MILSNRINNLVSQFRVRVNKEPYLLINIILAGVILLILAYSGIFSPEKDNYPITCIHEKLTGEPCISCGLSHSFSLIVRGRISEAYEWNAFGMRVFLFFISQLCMRVTFLLISLRYPDSRQQLIIYDCVVSGIIFLISFWPFLGSIFSGI